MISKTQKANASTFNENNIVFRIASLSDTHIGTTAGQVGFENGYTFEANINDANGNKVGTHHVNYPLMQNLETAMGYFKLKYGSDIDAIMHQGDMTENGQVDEVNAYFAIQNQYFEGVPFSFVLGNHDSFWTGSVDKNGDGTKESYPALSREGWFNALNAHGVYDYDQDLEMAKSNGNRHMVVEKNGMNYHFVSVDISYYMGATKSELASNNPLAPETKTWLVETLNKIERLPKETNFPYVFINAHAPATNTSYGSLYSTSYEDTGYLFSSNYSNDATGLSAWGCCPDLDVILQDYPQAILMTGHTHGALNDERNINQTTYTQINCGSTSGAVMDGVSDFRLNNTDQTGYGAGSLDSTRRKQNQTMVIEIDDQGMIRFTRFDLFNGETPSSGKQEQIKDVWVLNPYAEDGSHLTTYNTATRVANNVAPSFNSGATATVSRADNGNVSVTFPTATDDDMVLYYDIQLINADDNAVAYHSRCLGKFYEYPDLQGMPTSQTFIIARTDANVLDVNNYYAVIYPVDSFGKWGTPLTSGGIASSGTNVGSASNWTCVAGANNLSDDTSIPNGVSINMTGGFGSRYYYKNKIKLDGSEITIKYAPGTNSAFAFTFLGDDPTVHTFDTKDRFNAIFWSQIYGATAQDRLVIGKGHDYNDNSNYIASASVLTDESSGFDVALGVASSLVFNYSDTAYNYATLKFTDEATCWKVTIVDNYGMWGDSSSEFYVQNTYIEPFLDGDGKCYLGAVGFCSTTGTAAKGSIGFKEAEASTTPDVVEYPFKDTTTPEVGYNGLTDTFTINNLRRSTNTVALMGIRELDGMKITLSSKDYGTTVNNEQIGVILKNKPIYYQGISNPSIDGGTTTVNNLTNGLHFLIMPKYNDSQVRVALCSSNIYNSDPVIYKDSACTTANTGWGVSTVEWVGNGSNQEMSFSITFNWLIDEQVWKVTLEVNGTTSWSSSQNMVGYIKHEYMTANVLNGDWQTYAIAYGNSTSGRAMSQTIDFDVLQSKISYNANGGQGEMADQFMRYGASKNLNANTFVRDGYKFIGWSTDANGTVMFTDRATHTVYRDGSTLYAIWEQTAYTVNWKNYDGSILDTDLVNVGETPSYTGETPVRVDADNVYTYTFTGWSPAIGVIDKDTDYVAQYSYIINAGASLSLGGDFALNFYLYVPAFTTDENSYVELTYNHNKTSYSTERTTDTIYINTLTPNADGRYKLSIGLAPGQIADLIDITLFDSNGDAVYEVKDYSILDYCNGVIENNSDAKLVDLCKAIVNYASYTQIYFEYNDENVANLGKDFANDINSVSADDITAMASIVENADGFALTGVKSFMVHNKGAMRFYYALTDTELANYTITVSDNYFVRTGTSNAGTYVEVFDILATQLADSFTITITNNNTGNSTVITYSVLDFVKDNVVDDTANAKSNLCKAIYQYSVATNAYFA